MYLSQSIQWRNEKLNMVGIVPGDVVVGDRPQGRGYVLLEETGKSPWTPVCNKPAGSETAMPAHEFHYARLENLSAAHEYAYKVARGHGIDGNHDGIIIDNLLAGFAHHRNTAANPWVGRFVTFVREKST